MNMRLFCGAALVALRLWGGATPVLAQADVVTASVEKPKRLTPMEQVDQHIKRLHAELKITAAQAPLWDVFASAMHDNATHMEGLYQARAQGAHGMNAVESMKSSEQIAEAHAQDLQKLEPPFEALYASMDMKQKKTADRIFHNTAPR
jgi:hypothetical protein